MKPPPKKIRGMKKSQEQQNSEAVFDFRANLSYVDISFGGVGGCFFLANKNNHLTTSGLGTPKQRSRWAFHTTARPERGSSQTSPVLNSFDLKSGGKKDGESETYRFLDELFDFCWLLTVVGFCWLLMVVGC